VQFISDLREETMNKRPIINSDFSKNEGNERSRDLWSNPTEIQKKEMSQGSILEESQIKESTFLKKRMTIQMNKETIERAKNAVY